MKQAAVDSLFSSYQDIGFDVFKTLLVMTQHSLQTITNIAEKHAASTCRKEVMMEALSSLEELVTTHRTKWCHDTQQYNPNTIQKLVLPHTSL
jgi:hypothetical protein